MNGLDFTIAVVPALSTLALGGMTYLFLRLIKEEDYGDRFRIQIFINPEAIIRIEKWLDENIHLWKELDLDSWYLEHEVRLHIDGESRGFPFDVYLEVICHRTNHADAIACGTLLSSMMTSDLASEMKEPVVKSIRIHQQMPLSSEELSDENDLIMANGKQYFEFQTEGAKILENPEWEKLEQICHRDHIQLSSCHRLRLNKPILTYRLSQIDYDGALEMVNDVCLSSELQEFSKRHMIRRGSFWYCFYDTGEMPETVEGDFELPDKLNLTDEIPGLYLSLSQSLD